MSAGRPTLCFSTLGCPDWSWERILDAAQELGFAAVELRGVQQVMDNTRLPGFAEDHLVATTEDLARRGLRIACLDTSVHLTRGGGANLDEAVRNMRLAARLGAPYIRVFGDYLTSTDDVAVMAASLDELAAIGEPLGVRPLIEVHGDVNTIEIFSDLFSRLGHTNSGVLWDVGHSHKAYGRDFRPFLDCVRPHLYHVHMKDEACPPGGSWRPVRLGEGDVPMAEIVTALVASGFDGALSFEHELRWKRDLESPEIAFPRYVELMRAALDG